MGETKKMICLVDGEHYFPVVKDSIEILDDLEHIDVVAVVFIGGTEKLQIEDPKEYSEKLGKPVFFGPDPKKIPYDVIKKCVKKYNADIVMDLSDEPVVDYTKRFRIASIVLKEGAVYQGADFKFEPLTEYDVLEKPSIKIIGTGKRIGKTAVSAYAARVIHKHKYNPCVVAMGRGGPREPEIVEGNKIEITAEYLLEQADKGVHAASDHWEDALMSRILTVGCRRCGGGMLGDTFITNVKRGAEIANKLDSDFVIMEGSGAAIPPVKTNRQIVTVGANQPMININNFFGPFRIGLADLVIITMCEEPMATTEKIKKVEKFIKEINPSANVIPTVFRPKPVGNVEGKKVLFATTAPKVVVGKLVNYLESKYGCDVVGVTPHLSNRPLLRRDLKKYINKADLMLTELKAAAVDVATRVAIEAGLNVVYCDNIPVVIDESYGNIDDAIIEVVEMAIDDFKNNR